jgi:hypothetical protein
MYEADRPLTVLYFINVMQPVSMSRLKSRLHRLSLEDGRRGGRQEGVEAILGALAHSHLILKRADRYSVTARGLRKLTSLGLGRVRDKRRLFLLNRLL